MNLQKIENKTNFNKVLSTIQNSKHKALKQVNNTLIELYWEIGQYISTKTIKENWGKSIVKELAIFIKQQDPTIKGFSDKNLWRMKQFYETYHENEKLSAVLRELTWTNNLLILSSSKTKEEREFYILMSLKEFVLECRSLSPTVVSEYETKLIPKKVLQDKIHELYKLYDFKSN